ncbi:FAD-dependent oxidoreductase [Rudanella lutea]|uniref:FAD-dependent oxidoreductase n=1 Tax=Rudanella lutea TaxID=451374 RepID=UPI000373F759|nr:FAD-dependent oxidoreductase [Rudanella lutea]
MTTDYTEAAVCHIDDLHDGQLKEVRVGDTDVLLARVDGQYYALYPKCSHYGAPLAKGVLHGHRLVCPWHNACFDATTGHRLEAPALNGLPMHEVRIESDQVLVRLTTDAQSRTNPLAAPQAHSTETYVIVGAGGAGAFAAEALREGGFTGRIVMLTQSPNQPYDRPNCSKDYLQGKAPAEWMPLREPDFYKQYGIEIRTETPVKRLDAAIKEIVLQSGETIRYDKALICTGGAPNHLPVPGADLRNVFTLRTLTDSSQLRLLGQQGKRVVIVGSSFIGLEAAMSLRKLGAEVAVVGREAVPFAKVLGEKIGRLVQGWHEKAGIRFHLGREVRQFDGTGEVSTVVLDNGLSLPADVVLLGLGVKPRTDFLENVPRADDGGVLTDEYLQLADGLYAAGDIAHFPTPDGPVRIEHWKVAGQQGHVAGLNMARPDAPEPYRMAPFFWTNQQGKRINYVGHAEQFDQIIYDGDPETDDSFLAFYGVDGVVKAVASLGRDTDIAIIRELMQNGQLPHLQTIQAGVDWPALLAKVTPQA